MKLLLQKWKSILNIYLKKRMTSRERVLAALNHRESDRVPIDLSGHRSSGISGIAYNKLRKHLGFPSKPVRIYDIVQQLAIVDEDVLDLFRIDTIELGRAFALDEADWADWVLPDGTPCRVPIWTLPEKEANQWVLRSKSGRVIAVMPESGFYFEQAYYPFFENDDLDAIHEVMEESMWCSMASPPGPLTEVPDGDKILAAGARTLRASSDRIVIGLFGGNLLELGQFLYRNDRFLMLLAENPRHAHKFLDKITEMHLADLDRFLGAVGNYIDVILFGDDLGMQSGPQISPTMYREFFKPRHMLMWKRAKELADVKIMLHCCGSIRELIPDLIDAGLDAINPVQISSRGMDAKELKANFGDKLVFWGGGCDTQNILNHGSPEEVRQHVKNQVSVLSPGGGFVFQQVHNILPDVPPENIVALFEAVSNTE
ncbi:MAG: methyltransferase [Candidatus Aminicenantes bacterium]|nr:MAG: methyltransferase [Candidatus Aminicenantes bacterium]